MDQILQAPPPIPPAPPAAPPSVPVSFTGDRGDFIGLAFKGGILEIITVGFYRFWLATDIRRHLWSHTVVDGDSPEYTGRGLELFIGFLIAAAIVVPIYVVYFLLGLEAERYQAFASVPLVLFFYLFFQFAIYRARRYRLTRTVWRGVRFGMTGSGWAYAFRAFGCGILIVLTLGIFMPWRDAILERYKQRHSHYGDLEGSFVGTGGGLFKRIWWLWGIAAALFVAMVALQFAPSGVREGVGGLLVFAYLFGLLFMFPIFRAIQWRWWLEGLRFGGVRVDSNLPASRLIGLYWKVIGWSLLLITVFSIYVAAVAFVVVAGGSISAFSEDAANLIVRANDKIIPLYALLGVGYLLLIVFSNLIMRVYFVRDVWQRVSESATVHGIEQAAAVAASGEVSSALGEGLLGDLDIGGL